MHILIGDERWKYEDLIADPDGELVRLDIMHSGGLVVFAEGLIHEMGSLYARFAAWWDHSGNE